MPTIKITDNLNLGIDAQLAPGSTFLKYARELPGMLLTGADISKLQLLTVSDPAVRSLTPALSFNQPVNLGEGAPALTLAVDAGVAFQILSRSASHAELFDADDYGDNIEIPPGACYVRFGLHANAGPQLQMGSGALTFGLDAQAGIAIDSYRPFPAGDDAPLITEALRQSIGAFVIPAQTADLEALPPGTIVTVSGHGSLTISADANLLAVVNPLATASLPSPLPALSVRQGASVTVGASWQISSDYQVRAQKLDATRVRLGWLRRHASEFTVTASATAGVSAGTDATDFVPMLIGAISPNAKADLESLQKAGLSEGDAQAVGQAVQAAVSRKLEIAVAAEFGSLSEDEAAFLYEVDLTAIDAAARAAIDAALKGDLSGLDASPKGVTEIRSVLTKARASHFSLKVNLLGIFNIAALTTVGLTRSVTWVASTGELVLSDEATASRIRTTAVNFGADEQKLRQAMAESFLITAAYRVSGGMTTAPELGSSHSFFRLDNKTSRSELQRALMAVSAAGVSGAVMPAGPGDFGRTTVVLEARYDDGAAHALFLKPDGTARSHKDYETAGRRAIAMLVPPDADDSFRLRPATDDHLWTRMSDLGPANFEQLLPAAQANGVRPDYLVIQWWADSMRSTAELLAGMDSANAKSRDDLARHLRDVAAKAHELFGEPWGLVAMYLVSGGSAATSAQITGQSFVFTSARPLAAAG